MEKSTFSTKAQDFFREHRGIIVVMVALLLVRVMAMCELGYMYSIDSDDVSYIHSGIYFAKSGTVTMHDSYPSAQVMPGMAWLIGLFSAVFGEGNALWLSLKLAWIMMGTASAWFIYKTVCLYTPKWCGIVSACCLFGADYVWMDNLILTETPAMLCMSMMIYFTIQLSRNNKKRYLIGCIIAYMCAVMFKANFGIYPLFAAIFLICTKYSVKRLLKQGLILCCVMLCFFVPWSIRNYAQFNAFIPLTYGSGNPTLQGTYQGFGYPTDDELDYETNVDSVLREKYADYFDENGVVTERFERYINLKSDGIKALYRLKEWAKKDFKGFIFSILVIKPHMIIDGTFYWDTVLGIGNELVGAVHHLNFVLCVISSALSIYLKKYRKPIFFAIVVYLGNVYVYAITFAFGRYNASLMPARFIIVGIGFALFRELILKTINASHAQNTSSIIQ